MKRLLLFAILSASAFAKAPLPIKVDVDTGAVTDPITASLFKSGNNIQPLSANLTDLSAYTHVTLPVSTPVQAALNAKATVFTLEQYGGGTGISDNSTAFQAAIDAASAVGGTVQLGEGRYQIRGALTVGSSVRIVGRGAKTILDGKYLLANGNGDGGLYYDSYLSVASPVDTGVTVKTFSGAIATGTKSFTLNNVAGLSVGDFVWFQIGTDATDPGEEQLRFIDEITGISGSTITVKTGINEPVSGNPTTAGAHHCSRLLSPARNVIIENVTLDYLGINVHTAESVRVSDIRIIEGTAPFLVAEFNGLVIERVVADSIHGVNGPNGLPWYGWFIQGWGMRGMVVRDIIVKRLQGVSLFSCESQTRNVSIENIQFGALGGPIQFIPFACLVDLEYPITVKNLAIYSLDNGFLYTIGKTFKYENISFTSAAGDRYFGVNLADVSGPIRFKDSVYSNRTTVRRVIRPSASSAGTYDLGVTGLLSSMHVYCSTKTGLTGFVHYNGSGSSTDLVSAMTAGAFVEYYDASNIGGPNQFSDTRSVYVTTGSSWPADGTIIVEAEVIRKAGNVEGVPELTSGSGAPSVSASQIGQEYYDRTNTRYWKSITTGTGASDWVPLFTVTVESLMGTTLPSSVTASSLTSFGPSPALGTPASGVLTNATGLPLTTGVTGQLAIANGGTNSNTASGARTALGVAIGSNVQAWSANLDSFSSKTAPSGVVVGTTDSQALSNKELVAPTVTNYLSLNSATTSGVTGFFQTGNDVKFGASFGSDSSVLMLGSNNGNNVGLVKADLGGGDMLIGKGLFGAFTEWMRIKDSTGRIGIGTSSPGSLLDVNGTVTATLFSGPLTGNVTGNAATATALATARTINGTSFDGSANITAPVHVISYSGGTLTITGDDGHQYQILATQL